MNKVIKYIVVMAIFILSLGRRLVRGKRKAIINNSRCLVVSLSGIGNAIMATPLIEALLKNAAAAVDVLTLSPAHYTLFNGIGLCRRIFIYPTFRRERRSMFKMLRKQKYDILLLSFPTPEIAHALLAWTIHPRAAVTHAYDIYHPYFKFLKYIPDRVVPVNTLLHDVEQNLALIQSPAQSFHFTCYPPFTLATSAHDAALAFFATHKIPIKNTIVVMHPGCKSGADYKRWPLEYFLSLGEKLAMAGKVIVMLGPDEQAYRDLFQNKNFVLFESTDFAVSLAVLAKASLLVSNDSGIMHAAAFLQVPTVTVWGGTDVKRNGARGNFAVNVVNENAKCRPCVQFVPSIHCPHLPYECMRDIEVDRVYDIIRQNHLLEGGGKVADRRPEKRFVLPIIDHNAQYYPDTNE